MKKRLFTLLMLLAATATLLTAAAYDFKVDGIFYEIISSENNQCKVTHDYVPAHGGDYLGDIVIPSTVNNNGIVYDVVEIGEEAFMGCSITSIELGTNVKILGSASFKECDSLKSISLPVKLTKIGESAFYKCQSLTEIIVPEHVTDIDGAAFMLCSSLKKIDLPESLRKLGGYAFYGCPIEEVDLPPRIRTLNKSTFEDCTSLRQISLPKKLNEIYENVFAGCTSLKQIELPSDISYIRESTFSNSGLEEITLPESLLIIGKHAFWECKDLKEVSFGPNLSEIYDAAFYRCSSLATAKFSEGLEKIGELAFSGTGLTELCLPNSISSLGERAFEESSIKKAILPDGLETIPGGLFMNCAYLTEVRLPRFLKYIEFSPRLLGAFENCTSLSSIQLPEYLLSIGPNAFAGTSLKEIKIPSRTEEIFQQAFMNCTKLEYIELPSSLTGLGERMFVGCPNLSKVVSKNPEPPRLTSGEVFDPHDPGPFDWFDNNVKDSATLMVRVGSLQAYQEALRWAEFRHIVEVDFSGIDDVVVDEPERADGPVSVYNLQGVKVYSGNEEDVSSLPAGLYIIRHTDGTSQKRLVR